MQIVLNSCKLLVFKRYAMRKLWGGFIPRYMSLNHPLMTDHTTSYIVTQANLFETSSHCTQVYNHEVQRKNILSKFLSDWNHSAHVHSFWKQGIFLSTVSFWWVLFPFFVSCTCLHCISHCPKKRNNIKCIIFVVLDRLLFICLTLSSHVQK